MTKTWKRPVRLCWDENGFLRPLPAVSLYQQKILGHAWHQRESWKNLAQMTAVRMIKIIGLGNHDIKHQLLNGPRIMVIRKYG